MVQDVIQGNDNTTRLIAYIKKQAAQYPVLSKEQERELIEKHRNNREKLNQLLVLHNIRAVFSFAKKYKTKTRDFDSLIQDGFQGLALAASKFDLNRNIKFITYAYWYLHKYVLKTFNDKSQRISLYSISIDSPDMPGLDDNENAAKCVDAVLMQQFTPSALRADLSIKTPAEFIEAQEKEQLCADIVNMVNEDTSLSAMQKEIFNDIYCQQKAMSSRDLALKYGLSATRVAEIKNELMDRLRSYVFDCRGIKTQNDICA